MEIKPENVFVGRHTMVFMSDEDLLLFNNLRKRIVDATRRQRKVYIVSQNMVGYLPDFTRYFRTKLEAVADLVREKKSWREDEWGEKTSVRIYGSIKEGGYYIERWPDDIGFNLTLSIAPLSSVTNAKTEEEIKKFFENQE